MRTMSRTYHHSKRHSVALANPVISSKAATEAIQDRANTIIERSKYYSRNVSALNHRIKQGKVSIELANRIRPSIVAQVFRDARIPLVESRILMRSLGMR